MLYTYPVFAKNHLPHRGNLSSPSPGLLHHLGHITLSVKFNILCTDFQFHGTELSQLRHWLLQGRELGDRVVQRGSRARAGGRGLRPEAVSAEDILLPWGTGFGWGHRARPVERGRASYFSLVSIKHPLRAYSEPGIGWLLGLRSTDTGSGARRRQSARTYSHHQSSQDGYSFIHFTITATVVRKQLSFTEHL